MPQIHCEAEALELGMLEKERRKSRELPARHPVKLCCGHEDTLIRTASFLAWLLLIIFTIKKIHR